MPSSVGHALAGFAVVRLAGGRLRRDWPYVLLAASADLDIALRLLADRPLEYSLRRSHSAAAALAVGAVAGAFAILTRRRVWPHVAAGTATYASHLLLDYFGKDAESGLPLLWPLSKRTFAAPQPVFRTIYSRRDRFIRGLLTRRNVHRIAREVAILSPVVAAAQLFTAAQERRSVPHTFANDQRTTSESPCSPTRPSSACPRDSSPSR